MPSSFREDFLNFSQSETRIANSSHDFVESGMDEMRISYRGPSIDASCKISFYLVKLFQSTRLFEIDKSETRIAYSGHVCKWNGTKWVIFIEGLPTGLPTQFRWRFKCEKLIADPMPSDDKKNPINVMLKITWIIKLLNLSEAK